MKCQRCGKKISIWLGGTLCPECKHIANWEEDREESKGRGQDDDDLYYGFKDTCILNIDPKNKKQVMKNILEHYKKEFSEYGKFRIDNDETPKYIRFSVGGLWSGGGSVELKLSDIGSQIKLRIELGDSFEFSKADLNEKKLEFQALSNQLEKKYGNKQKQERGDKQFCSKCGESIKKDSKFCSKCGKKQ